MFRGMVILFCLVLLVVGCSPVSQIPDEVIAARDKGIQTAMAEGIAVPQSVNWSGRNITPQNLLGYSTYEFTIVAGNEQWRIRVGYPVVPFPEYRVTIYRDDVEVWEGTVAFPTPMVPQQDPIG